MYVWTIYSISTFRETKIRKSKMNFSVSYIIFFKKFLVLDVQLLTKRVQRRIKKIVCVSHKQEVQNKEHI